MAEREREAERQRLHQEEQAARDRAEADARRPPVEQPQHDPVPPPSRADLIAGAKARYEATLLLLESAGLSEMELRGAKEKAKREYLKELDRVLT